MVKRILFIAVLAGMVNVNIPQEAHAMHRLVETSCLCKKWTTWALCGACVLTCMSLTSLMFQEVDELSLSKQELAVPGKYTSSYVPVSRAELSKINVNYRRSYDLKTPLHEAVERGDDNAIVDLILRGAKVNAPDIEGNTPLHIAVKNYRLAAIRFLRCCNARMDIKNKEKITALEMAEEMGYKREEIDAFYPSGVECG